MLREKSIGVTCLFWVFFSVDYGRRKRNAFRIQVAKGRSVNIVSKMPNSVIVLWLLILNMAELFLAVFEIISNEKEREDLAVLESEHVAKRARQQERNE